MKLLLRLSLLLVLAALISSCKKAPPEAPVIVTSITGKVVDATSGTGLSGAQVTTSPATSSYITGSDGTYTISDLQAGQYTVTASKTGYNTNSTTVTIAEGQSVTADIALSQTAPELAVSAQTMDFGSVQTNNTFTISNQTGVGTINWQLSYDQPWMTVTPASGSVTTNSTVISVAVNRDSLNYGNYSGVITVSSDHGSKQVNVVMVKQNPNAPQVTVKPTTLDFGSSTNTLSLTIQNTGTGALTWTAGSNSSWLTVSQTSGSATSTNPSIVNVSVNRSGLTANTYQGAITVTTNGGTQTVTVNMQVLSGTVAAPTLQVVGGPTATSITVGWTKSTDATFQSYKLFRSSDPGVTENSILVTTITSASSNNYTDNNLSSGVAYYYRVFAYGTNGVGSGSNEVSATTAVTLGTWASVKAIPTQSSVGSPNSLSVLSDKDIGAVAGGEVWQFDGSNWTKNYAVTNQAVFNAIFMLNDNLGWAITNGGGVTKWNGITWTLDTTAIVYGKNMFYDVVATSASNVFVAGSGNIYYFNGSTWTGVGVAVLTWDLDMVSQNLIFALADNGSVYKFDGSGWSVAVNTGTNSFYGGTVSAVNSNDIWWTSNYSLWHFYNGSSTKISLAPNNPSAQEVCMLSASDGWCSCVNDRYDAGFYHYDGTQWTAVTNPTSYGIMCIRMLSSTDGWALASNGALLHYTK